MFADPEVDSHAARLHRARHGLPVTGGWGSGWSALTGQRLATAWCQRCQGEFLVDRGWVARYQRRRYLEPQQWAMLWAQVELLEQWGWAHA